MKEKEKGFTLIELLAVIVILGLLIAIAIPSVTKYITQSRRKTLVKTIDSYVTAVVNQVNDGDYYFSDSTKIFAVPIECVSLEKGGTDPFGNWYQANDAYWAYVLVQYDSENYNYIYGFTFKDDAGYGMYPTTSANIDESGKQIRTGYDDLNKPNTGLATSFVSSDKWNGFNITSTTELVVLEAESEGVKGDGETTCTLCQKGDNYNQIEEEKMKNLSKAVKLGDYVEMTPTSTSYTIDTNYTGYTGGSIVTINPSELNIWRVIKINNDGTIELISDKVSSVSISFAGMKGYANYVGYLNVIASQYENEKYTIGSRAMGYNGQTEFLDYDILSIHNSTPSSTSKYICTSTTVDNSKEAIGCGDMLYENDVDLVKNALGTLTTNGSYYLASRHVSYNPASATRLQWMVRLIYNNVSISGDNIKVNCTNSCGYIGANPRAIRPIVVLKSGLKVASGSGTSSSPWILE